MNMVARNDDPNEKPSGRAQEGLSKSEDRSVVADQKSKVVVSVNFRESMMRKPYGDAS